MKRLLSVALWSVLAAAFIGPGTVATAAKAGAEHRYALLWALLFSTLACLILQEASARLALVSGLDLAAALRRGAGGSAMVILVLGSILLGCTAYEAGNLLGAVAGAGLVVDLPAWVLTLTIGAVAAALLAAGSPRTVALVLSLLVAVMGLAFVVTAFLLGPELGEIFGGMVVPRVPAGSGLLVLGLIGTTVVPYNLFLGSGLARDNRAESLAEQRFGLSVAILLGGLISMAVLVVGVAVVGEFSYQALGEVLAERLGGWARALFAVGLLTAGLSSAVTAPLAAALTARGLFAGGQGGSKNGGADLWAPRSWRYRAVWICVLVVGVAFGAARISPIPAIIAAQAFNGVVLPVVALFLLFAVNDRRLMGATALNGPLANLATAAVVVIAVLLGLLNLGKAVLRLFGGSTLNEAGLLWVALAVTAILAFPVSRRVAALRR